MRRSSPDRSLPWMVVQGFLLLLVGAITAAAIIAGNTAVLLAVLTLAGSVLGVGGFLEKSTREVRQALAPPDPPEPS